MYIYIYLESERNIFSFKILVLEEIEFENLSTIYEFIFKFIIDQILTSQKYKTQSFSIKVFAFKETEFE